MMVRELDLLDVLVATMPVEVVAVALVVAVLQSQRRSP